MDNAIKYCRDCRHFVGGNCQEERNMRVNYVKGGYAPRNSADFLRADIERCGPDGAWHEQMRGVRFV